MQCALLTEHWLAAFDSRAVAFSVFLPLFSCLLLYSSALFFISTTTIKMHHLERWLTSPTILLHFSPSSYS